MSRTLKHTGKDDYQNINGTVAAAYGQHLAMTRSTTNPDALIPATNKDVGYFALSRQTLSANDYNARWLSDATYNDALDRPVKLGVGAVSAIMITETEIDTVNADGLIDATNPLDNATTAGTKVAFNAGKFREWQTGDAEAGEITSVRNSLANSGEKILTIQWYR